MTNLKTWVITAVIALVVLTLVGIYFVGKSNQSNLLSGLSERDIKAVSLSVGQEGVTAGTRFTFIKTGTCTLLANFSIAATSTGQVDCVITGIRSGDLVDLMLAPSTTRASQYVLKASHASTTAGYATAELINLTGTAATPAATNGFGSSTVYKLYRASN